MVDRVNQKGSRKRKELPASRIETAHLRQLPDFVIIGAQRGGTTSMYHYLTGHPDVGPASEKEVGYFDHDRRYAKGLDWYRTHFPLRGEAVVVGEASPNYLFEPLVPERIRAAVPNAKFIALLRNPVDRAFSSYQLMVRRGREPLSFEDAIASEPERRRRGEGFRYSYVARGLYMEQLERWLGVFPREQFLILKSEDFYRDPEQVLHQTLAFLGLRPWSPPTFHIYQSSWRGSGRRRPSAETPAMEPATRSRLVDYFAPHNQRLYAFLGRDLGWEGERE